jgi:hypothetical protein
MFFDKKAAKGKFDEEGYDREIAYHLEELIEANLAAGCGAQSAALDAGGHTGYARGNSADWSGSAAAQFSGDGACVSGV